MAPVERTDRAITERVIRAREESGLQKTELAEKIGLSKSGYHHYEKFEAPFTVAQIFQISRILGRSVGFFLGIDCGLTPDEDELLTAYRNIKSEPGREFILRIVKEAPKD
jgi:transcriptional regulator with XRE-family HTH domain